MNVDDYVAVIDVLNRYADVCDSKQFERFDDVFTADGTMDYSTIPDVHVGPREIADNVRRSLGGCGATQHLLGNFAVEVDGDVARASCKVRAFHLGIGAHEGETFEALATYNDRLVRTAAGWRIAARTMEVAVLLGNIGVLQPPGDEGSDR
jgi:3-phenylpropionate/cinnamic acid dioxygenase small subunit